MPPRADKATRDALLARMNDRANAVATALAAQGFGRVTEEHLAEWADARDAYRAACGLDAE